MNSDSASGCLPIILGAPPECLLLGGQLRADLRGGKVEIGDSGW